MNTFRYLTACLLLALSTSGWAGQDYQLYVNGVLYKAPSILEKGLPYFPVDVLSEATGVRIVSFSDTSVRLAGSPVDFVPVVRSGRPYLPAEAFAMASGSSVENDGVRGVVLYTGNVARAAAPAASGGTGTAAASGAATGPDRANPGVAPNDSGPEAPVAAPVNAATSSPNTQGIHSLVVDAMKNAQEVTYAQRWLQHKMYWANQLDPANSPYLRVVPPIAPTYAPHPWIGR